MSEYLNDKSNKLRYILYVRKSTEDEEKQVLSKDAQKDMSPSTYNQHLVYSRIGIIC